jgi:hypothetical protein
MATSDRIPPRFVPTLTEVVPMAAVPPAPPAQGVTPSVWGALQDAFTPSQEDGGPSGGPDLALQQESIIHRVMQRVDLALEDRLREAVASVVLEQVRVMAPRLRDEIEMVVREAVSEAVAEELAVSRGYGSGR